MNSERCYLLRVHLIFNTQSLAKVDNPDFTKGPTAAFADDQVAKRLKDIITTDIKSEITGLEKIIEKKEKTY